MIYVYTCSTTFVDLVSAWGFKSQSYSNVYSWPQSDTDNGSIRYNTTMFVLYLSKQDLSNMYCAPFDPRPPYSLHYFSCSVTISKKKSFPNYSLHFKIIYFITMYFLIQTKIHFISLNVRRVNILIKPTGNAIFSLPITCKSENFLNLSFFAIC